MKLTLGEIAKIVSGKVVGDATVSVARLDTIDAESSGALSFFTQGYPKKLLQETKACAVLLASQHLQYCPTHAIVVKSPRLAFAKVVACMHTIKPKQAGIHPSVVVGERSKIAASCSIGPNVVIGCDVVMGEHVTVGAGTVVGDAVCIGSNTTIHERVVIADQVKMGSECILYPGCVIGSEGFGHVEDDGSWYKIQHLSAVKLGDGVEVGANTTIDRGQLCDTVIDDHVKIDNQVQIGHNVHIGESTLIAGCVGIAGSATIGRYCLIGGGCLVNGHIVLVDRVVLTGGTTVTNSIKVPGVYSSCAVLQTHKRWKKTAVFLRRLPEIAKKLVEIEKSE